MESIFGVKTRLRLATGEVIEGWHYSKTDLGDYIAFDPEGKNIRFIPIGEIIGASYDHESSKAQFRPLHFEKLMKSYHVLESDLQIPMSIALDRLDINHLRRLSKRINNIRARLESDRVGSYHDEASLPLVLDARETHEELLDEIARSGVQDILMERQNQIRDVISEFTLPQIDAFYLSRYDLKSMIELAKRENDLSKTNLGKTPLEKLSLDVLATPVEAHDELKESLDENGKRKAERLRSTAAWLKVATGGGLAATNLALGALAGVISALPTLGLGTVAAAVGIATSTYTGLNAASDALKDMASNLEKE